MRSLKFRAWDKVNLQFVYFELFKGVNNHTPKIYEDGDFEPWEQFTGLLDCSQKEIYENDTIQHDARKIYQRNVWSSPVFFSNGAFKVTALFPQNTHYVAEASYGVGKNLGNWNMEYMEVIGNIHSGLFKKVLPIKHE